MSAMHLSFPASLQVTVLGLAIVFTVLLALNLMIKGLSVFAALIDRWRAPRRQAEVTDNAGNAGNTGQIELIADSSGMNHKPADAAGNIRLYGVDDRTAAVLMAIVAYKSGAPLHELRFRSIRARSI